jgi:hypothetical protein
MGDIVATSLSTVLVNANTLYANNTYIGSVSSPFNTIQFYGLFGQYNNTVLAEVSTGAGSQELLLFRGSSTSDRIRLQTTGSIVFEPGSSSRLWSSISSNVTPAMVIDINSNVGIKTTTTAGITLDVAGLARFQQVSTQNIQLSTINGQSFGAPINSSIIGLGSAGYVSTASLVSTTAFLLANSAGTISLNSTIQGLGSAGYVSTASLVSTTAFLLANSAGTISLNSTIQGLGSAGYVSTASLISTTSALQYGYQTAGFLSTASLVSTTSGLQYSFQTAGFLSSPNLLGMVSTSFLNTSLTSSVTGLGSASYVSTTSLISTTQALQYAYQTAGFLSTATLVSTVTGLGSAGYVSTPQLLSTTSGI